LCVTPTAAHTAASRGGSAGVPIDMAVDVYYSADRRRVLTFHCSFCHPFRQLVEVVGSEKTLRLDDYVRLHASTFSRAV
jgi:hypothetical protein